LLAAEHFASLGWRVRVVSLLPDKLQVHKVPAGVALLDLGDAVAAARLGDHWNRSLIARTRRFLRLWLHRLTAWLLLILLWQWLRRQRPPTGARLIRWLVRGVGGPQATLLHEAVERERPERILALLTRTAMLACQASWDRNLHLVVSERNDPLLQRLGFPWARLRPLLYKRADRVTANTNGVVASLGPALGLKGVTLLPNPFPKAAGMAESDPALREQLFLVVARLVPQKGVDVLLQALALRAADLDGWHCEIVGDGPERNALQQLAGQLGLTAPEPVASIRAMVSFAGFQTPVAPWFRRAAVFVLPSRFEGMPNALLEAMAASCPPIVTNSSPGPLELVEDGVSGLVVPADDPVTLGAALVRLASDPGLRMQLGGAARRQLLGSDWQTIEPIWRGTLLMEGEPLDLNYG
jgi:glycosyltransferase involved in cell wall biosynthesis